MLLNTSSYFRGLKNSHVIVICVVATAACAALAIRGGTSLATTIGSPSPDEGQSTTTLNGQAY